VEAKKGSSFIAKNAARILNYLIGIEQYANCGKREKRHLSAYFIDPGYLR
jgi:hypothetical protein